MIPVARWGTQVVLPYGSKKPRLWPRQTVRTVAGKPVDLSEWAGKQTSAKALRAATDAIMAGADAVIRPGLELRTEAEFKSQATPHLAGAAPVTRKEILQC